MLLSCGRTIDADGVPCWRFTGKLGSEYITIISPRRNIDGDCTGTVIGKHPLAHQSLRACMLGALHAGWRLCLSTGVEAIKVYRMMIMTWMMPVTMMRRTTIMVFPVTVTTSSLHEVFDGRTRKHRRRSSRNPEHWTEMELDSPSTILKDNAFAIPLWRNNPMRNPFQACRSCPDCFRIAPWRHPREADETSAAAPDKPS